MPKLSTRLTRDQLNTKVVLFFNQAFTFNLVNSGTSYPESKRNEFAKNAFDTAYVILEDAYNKKDINLFNRIYSEAKRLCAGGNITEEMKQMREEFDMKVIEFVQELKVYIANNGHDYVR